MDQNLIKILKQLRQIRPEPEYTKRSRFAILASEKNDREIAENQPSQPWRFNVLNPYYFRLVLAVLILLVLISGGVYFYLNKSNQNNLFVKASELNSSIRIKLDEIKYLIQNNQHLNTQNIQEIQDLLGKTANNLKDASSLNQDNQDLEKSLDKIKAAQQYLLQINALLK